MLTCLFFYYFWYWNRGLISGHIKIPHTHLPTLLGVWQRKVRIHPKTNVYCHPHCPYGKLGQQGRDAVIWEKVEIGNQSWIFIRRTNVEAPVFRPPDAKNWLIRKDPDAGKDWRQEEKGMTEDEMVGWHHQLDGHEFEQALGAGDGQGSLTCCSQWGCKELDTTK